MLRIKALANPNPRPTNIATHTSHGIDGVSCQPATAKTTSTKSRTAVLLMTSPSVAGRVETAPVPACSADCAVCTPVPACE